MYYNYNPVRLYIYSAFNTVAKATVFLFLYNIELFLIKKLEIMNTYVIVDGIVTILEWTVNING